MGIVHQSLPLDPEAIEHLSSLLSSFGLADPWLVGPDRFDKVMVNAL